MLKIIFALAFSLVFCSAEYKRVCYYANWSQYRNGAGKYDLKTHYETDLCTHLVFAFAKVQLKDGTIDEYELEQYEWNDKSQLYEKARELRSGSNLKLLLAVGGWTHSSNGFKQMVLTQQTRAKFINNAKTYLETHKFDGLDLDWEYPADRGSPAADKQRFAELCKEMKASFGSQYLLTAAVGASQNIVDKSYEVAKISQHLDFINLMSYDMFGGFSPMTGHQTDSTEQSSERLTLHNIVKYWIEKGAEPSKLVLGLAAYGRSFRLKDECKWGMKEEFHKNQAKAGQFTRESGFLSYYEICNQSWENRKCTKDTSLNAPYGANGDKDLIVYDDQESIKYKVEKIMKAYDLGGFMFWSLDLDDFQGNCGGIKYPLIKAARAAAENDNSFDYIACNTVSSTSCSTSVTTTTAKPTTTQSTTTKATSTSSQPTASTTATDSMTTKATTQQPSTTSNGSCYVPTDVNQRVNCKKNEATIYAGMESWCESSCALTPDCGTDKCCCDTV